MPLTDYERGYRAAQHRAIELAQRVTYPLQMLKLELAQPVPADASKVTVVVSGVVYYSCLDPHASGVPKEVGWPVPSRRPHGFGVQFVYSLTREHAAEMASHLETVGASLKYSSEPSDRAEGAANIKAARHIRTLLERETND